MMHFTPILAHGGEIYNLIMGTSAAILVAGGALLLCVVGWVMRDAFRFGRDGFPWLVAIGVSALFGGVGFWLVGYLGALVGAPFLVAFAYGRHVADKRRAHHE